MDCKQAKEIIKNNYPPDNYTMLREALGWLIEQAEKVERLKKEKKMFSDWVNELQVKNSELEHRLEHKIFE